MTTTPSPAPPLRVAFYGRCASGDEHDAPISLTWQYEACRRMLPPEAIVAVFYDLAPPVATSPAADRLLSGQTSQSRDGGMTELLTEAARPTRRFNHVITADPDRLSRRTRVATALLHHFAVHRLGLLYADGPQPDRVWWPGVAGAEDGVGE